ncbi:uncharacterized protein LOC143282302 [Babylonia areolata]|uniref:uncharacterized protein LOC143282302 n=1 Tax=Babylonia areolata TaxID=304850 RepID=UPI003FCFED28
MMMMMMGAVWARSLGQCWARWSSSSSSFSHRRRRGKLDTKRQTASRSSHSGQGKPEATKTESFTYTDALSATSATTNTTTTIQPNVSDNATTTYDVITTENNYEALDLPQYANMEGGDGDDHVYAKPVFARGTSQVSNTSGGGYVNLAAAPASLPPMT